MKYLMLLIFMAVAVAGYSQDTFQTLNDQGQKEIDGKNYQKAIEYYGKALEVGTDDTSKMVWTASLASMCAAQLKDDQLLMKYNNIALDYGSQDLYMIEDQLKLAKKYKDVQTTEKVLQIARNIDGKFEKYSVKLMYFYLNNKKYAETVTTADEVLALDSTDLNALNCKGVGLLQTGKEEEALKNFTHILNVDPENQNANLQMGMFFYNKAMKMFDDSNTKYEKIKEPTPLQYHYYKKEIVKSKPYFEKCLPYLQKYNSLSPQNSSIVTAIDKAKSRIKDLNTI
ncbi:MAG: tetratricopeptide repeat protein [Draconibacterium sp.]